MRARRRHVLLPLIPGLLLSIVAIAQVRLTRAEHLTPWKGGGFGMFSTTDDGMGRPMGIRISTPEGDREIGVPEPLAQQASRASVLPSRRQLSGLSHDIAEVATARGATVSGVRIAVWRVDYDPLTLAVRPVVVRDLRFDVREPAR